MAKLLYLKAGCSVYPQHSPDSLKLRVQAGFESCGIRDQGRVYPRMPQVSSSTSPASAAHKFCIKKLFRFIILAYYHNRCFVLLLFFYIQFFLYMLSSCPDVVRTNCRMVHAAFIMLRNSGFFYIYFDNVHEPFLIFRCLCLIKELKQISVSADVRIVGFDSSCLIIGEIPGNTAIVTVRVIALV